MQVYPSKFAQISEFNLANPILMEKGLDDK